MALEIGQIIEQKYRIVRLIGEGGMGEVYEGLNVRIQRRVAIKVLHLGFTSNADVVHRFEREAQAAGRIGNDHILEVLDLGSLEGGSSYMVMEFLDGEPLSKRIETRRQLTPREIAPLAKQLLQGLGAAHGAGIVHRDLKPDNIFILKEKAGKQDFVKIIDFGISKFQPLAGDGMKMTRTGAVMGTPFYMSPEQASGSREADARSDIYAVGVILFEAVTGRVPYDAPTFNQLLFQIVLSEPSPPSAYMPDLDRAFESIILKAMARDVDARFSSTQEFVAAIEAWERTGAAVTVPPPTQDLVAGARASILSRQQGAVSGQSANWSASQSGAQGSWPGQGGAPGGSWPGTPAVTAQAGSHPGAVVGTGSQPGAPAQPATGGSWATSQPSAHITGDFSVPKKSAAPAILAVIAGIVMLVGGIGLFLAFRGGTAPPASSTEPAAAALPAPATAPQAEAPAATATPPTASPVVVEPAPGGPSASASAAAAAKGTLPPAPRSGARTSVRPPTPPTKTGKKPPGGGDDFGY